ncbi:hypothetical protein [Desulfosporosinus nitroreducens]|uniref:Copper chaperone NosL n=1 Tax=Desulfosporosinus nitroreducens TaxID=2018668 RepID=A0ABT8QTF1_9FIRM|nr:hypothetical protein [Desulfosporosinus nitroreducens]MDO0823338.1 hypothetical protein [Desulfosporosinus nitroreducens]
MKYLQGKLSLSGRNLLLVAGLCLIASTYFPLWYMSLDAPQYPEGLSMIVFMDHIGGRIDIINNLNHYIGMKEIAESDFPEMQYMTYIAFGLAGLAFIAALVRRVWFGLGTLVLLIIGGGLGMYDLWYWLHRFGTELDSKAPIIIPPFVPPMIGSNDVANFVTHTGFGIGGYLLGLSICCMIIALWRFRTWENKENDSKPTIQA